MFRVKERDLTEGSLIRNIWVLAAPIMIANFLHDAFNLVDMFFVGKLGPAAIAAVSMSGVIMMIVIAMAIGISIGTVAMVSRFIGAKDRENAENVVIQSLFIALFLSIFIAVFGWFLSGPILRLLGANQEVHRLGVKYLRIVSVFSFTIFFSITLNSALRGAGDAVTPVKIMAFSTVLNIILDPIMIFGLLGFPRMGVAGSALATVIARACSLPILMIVFLRGYSYLHIKKHHFKADFNLMWRIIKIGIFSSIEALIRNISSLILISIVARFGTNAVAAYGIVLRLRMAAIFFGLGIGNAAATIVGQNLGSNKPGRAERSAWISCGLNLAIMGSVGIIYFIFANPIVRVFNKDIEVVALGVDFLHFVSVSLFFLAFSLAIAKAFQGAGETILPMITTGISLLLVRIVFALFLYRTIGVRGVWIALTISDIVNMSSLSLLFKMGKWKSKRI